ncbi:MAG: preprotein translocase subunit SecA [Spirochaetaceae bacterium]|nr:MAG: preprotein translocase subunit SecA [Spirochaetaceae bacterium]
MIHRVIDVVFGSKGEKDLKSLIPLLHQINTREAWAMGLTAEQFRQQTEDFRRRAAGEASLDEILPDAFALVREAARRTLGERLYDVQILGGIVLHQGKIMEMKTGEGKTVSSVTAAYLNTLSGNGVHVVTVNDYLAQRDADWMRPVFDYLGVSVGAIVSQMDNELRKEQYSKDITYATNNELGFDYLRDNMAFDPGRKVQRGHHFCIVDEIDSILVDEARTPLIISGMAEDDVRKYVEVNRVIGELVECAKDPDTGDYPEEPDGDYQVDEKGKRVTFTDQGLNHLETILQRRKIINTSLFLEENFEYIHHATQALRAHRLFRKDQEYVVADGKVEIVDEFTGRILHGRRYSDGLHQAIEAKEGIRIAQRNRTLATITFQNFFRMYDKISGMTGTAETEAKEFGNIYGLDVVVIPTNRPLARADEDDVIYLTEADKYEAICNEIEEVHQRGQPTLVGTVSIERSEKLSNLLLKRGIRHEVLNAKNHAREAMIIAEAGARGAVTIATNMAGRGTDIKLGGNPEFRARRRAGTDATREEYREVFETEYTTWREHYREVQEAGGLYVLGTERHESRRIDNQLRGRSGRQGDPGKSRFFLSMDDDLMRLFGRGSASIKSLMERGLPPGEPLNHKLINKSIERAQTKVEERNYEIRKHLLEYDDVLNEQRKLIYQQRDAILSDDDLFERVLNTSLDIVDELLADYEPDKNNDSGAIQMVLNELKERLFFVPETPVEQLAGLPTAQLKTTLLEDMRSDLVLKAETAGHERLNMAIRFEYLRNIDGRWQDHLENLEALREAVYLRSYAQKNPLLEYKLEGFQIFDQLIYDIRAAIARKLFAVKAESFQQAPRVVRGPANAVAQHADMQMIGGGAAPAAQSGGVATATMPQRTQVQRNVPKVGRNDPCPCGSGRKYKYCHGR